MVYFIWDEQKNQSNLSKHGIDFEEVKELFMKEDTLHFLVKNIDGEQRQAAMGILSQKKKLYICIYVFRKSAYRIISARRASENERKIWQEKI